MKTLRDTVAIDVTPNQLARIDRIDSEDFSGVMRMVREDFAKRGVDVSSEFLDRGVLALKQYYAVALLDPANMHAISDVIDPFWHMHILDTRRYTAFCTDVIGGYMHHDPLDHKLEDKVVAVRRLYDYTVKVFHEIFNHVDDEFYPKDVPNSRMICWHFGNSYGKVLDDAKIAAVPELADIYERFDALSPNKA